jgi:CBS domain-containing protein
VVDGDRLVGMVTLQDLRDVSRDRWEQTAVREIMTSVEDLATLEPEGDAADALQALTRRDVRQLAVLEGCRLMVFPGFVLALCYLLWPLLLLLQATIAVCFSSLWTLAWRDRWSRLTVYGMWSSMGRRRDAQHDQEMGCED